MKKKFLLLIIILRLITHDGVFINVRRPQPKPQPAEVRVFIRRTPKKGKKKWKFIKPFDSTSRC